MTAPVRSELSESVLPTSLRLSRKVVQCPLPKRSTLLLTATPPPPTETPSRTCGPCGSASMRASRHATVSVNARPRTVQWESAGAPRSSRRRTSRAPSSREAADAEPSCASRRGMSGRHAATHETTGRGPGGASLACKSGDEGRAWHTWAIGLRTFANHWELAQGMHTHAFFVFPLRAGFNARHLILHTSVIVQGRLLRPVGAIGVL
jgi:hypothetical protein